MAVATGLPHSGSGDRVRADRGGHTCVPASSAPEVWSRPAGVTTPTGDVRLPDPPALAWRAHRHGRHRHRRGVRVSGLGQWPVPAVAASQ